MVSEGLDIQAGRRGRKRHDGLLVEDAMKPDAEDGLVAFSLPADKKLQVAVVGLIDGQAGFAVGQKRNLGSETAFRRLLPAKQGGGMPATPVEAIPIAREGENSILGCLVLRHRLLDMHPFRADDRKMLFEQA